MQIERIHTRLIAPAPTKAMFALDATYVEDYWLSVIGPTSVTILRYVARHAATYGDPGATDDTAELAAIFGLGNGKGRWSPLIKTLDRLSNFGIARWDIAPDDADTLAAISIFDHVDAVPLGHANRWSAHRRTAHRAELTERLAVTIGTL